MTKIKVIARVRPFLPHEKVDDVISVKEGTLVVKDFRVPGLVTRYPYVLLQEETFFLPWLLAEISSLVTTITALTKPFLRSKWSRFSAACSRVLYGHSACCVALRSFHPLEDCVRVLLWRQLIGKDYDHVRKQYGPGHCPSGGPGEHPLRSSPSSTLMAPRAFLVPKPPTLTWTSKSV